MCWTPRLKIVSWMQNKIQVVYYLWYKIFKLLNLAPSQESTSKTDLIISKWKFASWWKKVMERFGPAFLVGKWIRRLISRSISRDTTLNEGTIIATSVENTAGQGMPFKSTCPWTTENWIYKQFEYSFQIKHFS